MIDLLRIAQEAVNQLSPQHRAIARVKEGLAVTLPELSLTVTADRLEITKARLPQPKLEQIVAWLAHRLGFERMAFPDTGSITFAILVAATPDLAAHLTVVEGGATVDSEASDADREIDKGPEVEVDYPGYAGPEI